MTDRLKFAAVGVATLLLAAPAGKSATATPLSGSIAGFVRDARGVPQMGASVLLFNRSERLIQQALTNERGIFGFESLPPDFYAVRISLASFVPAIKDKIAVQPGMQSLLYVDLASVLSSIELIYAAPGQGALMSDEWKWTLKASSATRPVLRALPETSASDPSRRDHPSGGIFSDTRGVLNVSAGDPGSLGGASSQSDMGTAFALATSVLGRNQVQFSGNFGYNSRGGMPAAGFRTSFSRDGTGPVVALTMQQIYLPARSGFALQPAGLPAIRTVSLSMHDSISLSDNLRLDYGSSLDSVAFVDHLNKLSKFGRLTYDLGANGSFQVGYSSGAPPTELLLENRTNSVRGENASLAEDLAALSLLPRISLLDGHAALQRTNDFEVGYQNKFGSTTVSVTAYREFVSNAAMTMVAGDDVFALGDVLPDVSSKSSILNAGSFQRSGLTASVAQALGQNFELGGSFGSGGALAASQQNLPAANDDALRSRLHGTQRFWASARASAKLPVTGTQITGSYQWMDYRDTIMPDHLYLTQNLYVGTGLNLRVQQPLPQFPGMPGRLEATAEVRNGLAQGYLPISEGAQRIIVVQSPRALRGGLSFIF